MKLTARQRRFAEGVARGKTYTQAAIDAGYSEKTAGSTGSENMTKPNIKQAVEEIQEKERTIVQRRFAGVINDMLNELIHVYYDEDTPPQVKSNIFKDISDRAGYKPVDKQETTLTGDLDISQRADLVEKYLGGDEG